MASDPCSSGLHAAGARDARRGRRHSEWLSGLAVLVALTAPAGACARAEEPRVEPGRVVLVDAALARAAAYLAAAQRPDGTWRSEQYGALRDDFSLTLPALKVLLYAPGSTADTARAARRALDRLAAAVRSDGTIDPGPAGLPYPVYTASLALIATAHGGDEEQLRARDAWRDLLLSHQLDERLGWTPEDLAYGGWGYSQRPLARPPEGVPTAYDADLSSTLFALGALRIAGEPADSEVVQRALRFVVRCQNLPLDGNDERGELDDGGFFFSPSPANEVQNKAGRAGVDATGRLRYRSYGSATADGLRALLRCGLAPDHPRVVAARAWLERHFDAQRNPGDFEPQREVERDAAWHYWLWSVSHAFLALGATEVETPAGPVDWRAAVSSALLERQRPDGSWTNRFRMVMEDEPLVATPFAAGALGSCRLSIARDGAVRVAR